MCQKFHIFRMEHNLMSSFFNCKIIIKTIEIIIDISIKSKHEAQEVYLSVNFSRLEIQLHDVLQVQLIMIM